MEFEIKFSETCLEEIEKICKYIKNGLDAENASNRLRIKIMESVQRLKSSPKLYAKINKTNRNGQSYRRIVIDNFVILYVIIEEDSCILISHMYYGSRNYIDGGIL